MIIVVIIGIIDTISTSMHISLSLYRYIAE